MVEKMSRWKYTPLFVFQIIILILYLLFVRYGKDEGSKVKGFEDTHVMIFIGFGFLMTFLKKYCYSALGFNWFLAALVIQWALLCQSFFHMKEGIIYVTKLSLLEADIMSATVLITFGALLGLTSATQLLFLAIIETVVGCINLYLIEEVYKVADIGGSMAIHAFGAYFGIGASTALRMKKSEAPAPGAPPVPNLGVPSYSSDVTAMIGSIFLWIYWPSFNSALAGTDASYQRAVVNTYLSLAAATVTSFIMSSIVNHQPGKFDMVHIQNSTLAGGVGVGAVANMFISPGGAIAVGTGAGILSVMGYKYLTPKLEKLGIQDTCGVNNLHGMPGVYSGILSVIFASFATIETYGPELHHVFEAMEVTDDGVDIGRSASAQAMYQLAALGTSLVLAFGAGLISGFIAKTPLFTSVKESERYDDEPYWELP